MSSDKLPQSVTVKKLVDSGSRIAGGIAAERLRRVADMVDGLQEGFQVAMAFGRNDDAKATIELQISGVVAMQCQRCLEPVTVPIAIDSKLVVVAHDEEARSRIKECEPIVLEDGQFDIYSAVEDEILLGLPLIAMHPEDAEFGNGAGCQTGHYETKESGAISMPTSELESNDTNDNQLIGNQLIDQKLIKVERRSEAGMENPFEVLKTLKTGGGQE